MNFEEIKSNETLQKVISWLPNKYITILAVYVTYMIFFDSNDFRSQFKLWRDVSQLKSEKKLLQKSLQEVVDKRDQLFTDKKSLEKFARERYYMKKEGETVFVIVEE